MSRINAALDCGYLDGRVEVDEKIFGRKIARVVRTRQRASRGATMASKCKGSETRCRTVVELRDIRLEVQ